MNKGRQKREMKRGDEWRVTVTEREYLKDRQDIEETRTKGMG